MTAADCEDRTWKWLRWLSGVGLSFANFQGVLRRRRLLPLYTRYIVTTRKNIGYF